MATAELLVSELVGNALRHGAGPLCLTLEWVSDVRCLVGDGSSQPPRLTEAGLEDEGGRGLALVDMLAARWGCERGPVGKSVWFELSAGADSCGPERMDPQGRGPGGLEGLEFQGVQALEGGRGSEAA
ncbi:ATP-binding protein [Streptomyces sp. R41]|uniref:ATP-binding protein n=1 Tax=Streptomyces sp. R41 TaxID=3238632 RepID=A0AB39R6C8_9ACTN